MGEPRQRPPVSGRAGKPGLEHRDESPSAGLRVLDELCDDGPVQARLAAEMVSDGRKINACAVRQRAGRHGGVAAFGKQRPPAAASRRARAGATGGGTVW